MYISSTSTRTTLHFLPRSFCYLLLLFIFCACIHFSIIKCMNTFVAFSKEAIWRGLLEQPIPLPYEHVCSSLLSLNIRFLQFWPLSVFFTLCSGNYFVNYCTVSWTRSLYLLNHTLTKLEPFLLAKSVYF